MADPGRQGSRPCCTRLALTEVVVAENSQRLEHVGYPTMSYTAGRPGVAGASSMDTVEAALKACSRPIGQLQKKYFVYKKSIESSTQRGYKTPHRIALKPGVDVRPEIPGRRNLPFPVSACD